MKKTRWGSVRCNPTKKEHNEFNKEIKDEMFTDYKCNEFHNFQDILEIRFNPTLKSDSSINNSTNAFNLERKVLIIFDD